MRDNRDQTGDSTVPDINQVILRFFRERKGDLVSGEELSSILNVSRTAVWKHINSLKELGYRFESIPSQGYRLVSTPDLLLPTEIADNLDIHRIGRRVICYTEADSTNTAAFRLAEEGAEEGTVVIADSQRSGKGRLGRRWESPAGVNLYCSIILRPPVLPNDAPQLTFLSSVAVAQAIEKTTRLSPQIKWPNDILVNGCKVAGLLNEMSAETEGVNFVILGIGVNINMGRDQFPDDLRHPASSLYLESGEKVSRLDFACALFTAIDELYESYLCHGYAAVREAWLSRSNVLGRRVRVTFHDRVADGVVQGIDDFGALILELPDGSLERVFAGDVQLL